MKKLVLFIGLVCVSISVYPVADSQENYVVDIPRNNSSISQQENSADTKQINQDQTGTYIMLGCGIAGMIMCIIAMGLIFNSSPRGDASDFAQPTKKK